MLKGYKEYKSTEIPWCQEMPSHWGIHRAKTMYEKMNRPVEKNNDVVTCFRDGMVTLRKNRRITGFTESIKEIGYQGIKKGDLVIHVMDAFAGAIGVSDSNGKGTPVYTVCTAKGDYNNYYYAFVIREMAKTGFIQSLYRGIRERSSDFRYEVFGKQLLPIPPRPEQDQIVRYLDWKVSMINRYINAKKKQIELLKERILSYLQIILKSQGAEFLRLKNIVTNEFHEINRDEKTTYIPIGVLNRARGIFHKTPLLGCDLGGSIFHWVENDVLVLSGQFAWEGAVALSSVSETGCIASHRYYTLRSDKEIVLNSYLWSYFISQNGDILLNQNSIGAAGRNRPLNINYLLKESIPVPSMKYQMVLDRYVHEYLSLAKFVKQNEKFANEYRARLISDVVTGKVDVRGADVPEFDYRVEDAIKSGDDEACVGTEGE
jgi:type I restriction enzyme S subunit